MKRQLLQRSTRLVCLIGLVLFSGMNTPTWAIDVTLSLDEAKQIIADGRVVMEKASSFAELRSVAIEAELPYRIQKPGDDVSVHSCLPSAIVQTKRFWLETLGRREAAESKRQQKDIRVPEEKIQEYLIMPNLGVEVRLCGDEEYFAEGAEVVLQQGSEFIHPVDFVPPKAGRKNSGSLKGYRSRFTARFAYTSFNHQEPSIVAIFFPDGQLINLEADFSKIK
ncbi:MAG: hypothetical protein GKS05_06910 [Nitrospirales bacterium]|nr:hypothetical protein [Nitrospirales bacterium]